MLAPSSVHLDRTLSHSFVVLEVFKLAQIRSLLVGIFLWTFGFAVLSSNLSALTETHLGWTLAGTSAIFLIVGAMGIVVQDVLIPRVPPRFGVPKSPTPIEFLCLHFSMNSIRLL